MKLYVRKICMTCIVYFFYTLIAFIVHEEWWYILKLFVLHLLVNKDPGIS